MASCGDHRENSPIGTNPSANSLSHAVNYGNRKNIKQSQDPRNLNHGVCQSTHAAVAVAAVGSIFS